MTSTRCGFVDLRKDAAGKIKCRFCSKVMDEEFEKRLKAMHSPNEAKKLLSMLVRQ